VEKKNITYKIIIFSIFFLCLHTQNTKAIPPIIGLYNILTPDDIGLGQSLLYSQWIKNVYLNAPKEDPARILIKTLWHIFYGHEDDQLIPTKKGPLAIITPSIFGKIIKYIYANKYDQEQKSTLINTLVYKCEWLKYYKEYIPTEIKNIENILVYLHTEESKISVKLENIENLIHTTEQKIQQIHISFKEKLAKSKKEKSLEIRKINKTMKKKSPEKAIAIKKVVQKVDLKYGIQKFKTIKEKTRQKLEQLKIKKREHIKEKNNIINEIEHKKLELIENNLVLENDKKIVGTITRTIQDLLQKIQNTLSCDLYIPRTTQAILWAFFESKFTQEFELHETLAILEKKAEPNTYNKNEYKKFEHEIKNLDHNQQIDLLNSQYDRALHSIQKRIRSGIFPPQIMMKKFAYEYAPGKTTETFSDCFESSALDLLSILWYNPITQTYDDNIFPPKLKSGRGFITLRNLMRTITLADKLNIKEKEYSAKYNYVTFTSVQKLAKIFQELKIDTQDIQNIQVSEINPACITRKPVRQAWVNSISGLKNIRYNQPENNCEILPRVDNFVNLLNHFYETDAKEIADFGPLLSYENNPSRPSGRATSTKLNTSINTKYEEKKKNNKKYNIHTPKWPSSHNTDIDLWTHEQKTFYVHYKHHS